MRIPFFPLFAGVSLLLLAAEPAVFGAEVRLGPETALSAQRAWTSDYSGEPIALASNGRSAIAVLETSYGTRYQIGAWTTSLRLVSFDADGRVTRPVGQSIAIYSTPPSTYGSAEALLGTNGEDYLLVWINGSSVYSQQFNDNGEALRPTKIVVPELGQWNVLAALIWNGSSYALIGMFGDGHTRAILLDREGRPIRELGFIPDYILWTGAQNGQFVVVAMQWDGAKYSPEIHHLNEFGARTTYPLTLPFSTNSSALFCAAASPDRVLFFEAVSGNFAITDYSGALLTRGTLPSASRELPSARWDGAQFVLSWREGGRRATRITPSGLNVDSNPLDLSAVGDSPLFVRTNSVELLLAWKPYFAFVHVLHGPDALASPLGAPQVLTQSGDDQSNVQIATGDGHRIALWCGKPDEGMKATFDGRALSLPRADYACGYLGLPSVAAGEQGFLIAANQLFEGVASWRVDFNGQVGNHDPIILDRSIAYDGPYVSHRRGRFDIVYATSQQMRTFTVTDDGGVAPGNVASFGLNASDPYLFRPLSFGGDALFPFARLGQYWWQFTFYAWDFMLADNGKTQSLFQSSATDYYSHRSLRTKKGFAAAATNGERLTFVWSESETTLWVQQTTREGKTIGLPRALAQGGVTEVEIVWNGTEYVVAWSSTASESSPRIRAIRLDAAANALDAAPFFVSPLGATRDRPSISVTESGVDIAYSRIDDTNAGAPRAFVRSLDRLQPIVVRRRSANH